MKKKSYEAHEAQKTLNHSKIQTQINEKLKMKGESLNACKMNKKGVQGLLICLVVSCWPLP
jgi:hypothetical protein